MKQKGLAPVIIIAILAILGIVGVYYLRGLKSITVPGITNTGTQKMMDSIRIDNRSVFVSGDSQILKVNGIFSLEFPYKWLYLDENTPSDVNNTKTKLSASIIDNKDQKSLEEISANRVPSWSGSGPDGRPTKIILNDSSPALVLDNLTSPNIVRIIYIKVQQKVVELRLINSSENDLLIIKNNFKIL